MSCKVLVVFLRSRASPFGARRYRAELKPALEELCGPRTQALAKVIIDDMSREPPTPGERFLTPGGPMDYFTSRMQEFRERMILLQTSVRLQHALIKLTLDGLGDCFAIAAAKQQS